MLRIILVASILCILGTNLVQSLDLGHGGVYDSPEAQKYWIERLGNDGLQAARNAGKFFRSSNTISKRVGIVKEKPVYYIPRYVGTYSQPSPLWEQENNIE